jgi:formyltetrahydrofolate-dependent phosphoribosylglycinamide formyltransferase
MAKARVAILISGRGSNMAALVYAAKHRDCPFEIALVTGDKPDAPGLSLAEAEGVPIMRIPAPTPKDKSQFYQALDIVIRKSGAQYVALAGFMRILPPDFVAKWEGRMLNIHPSLLPKYKGLDTHERALAAGDRVTGCTVHEVTEELDDGQILGQTEVAILPGDTPESLAARVLIAEHQLYSRVLAKFVTRESDTDFIIDQVRKLALAQPDAEETLSHGMPCFGIIKAKKFAYVSRDHHGDGKTALLVKISGIDEQAMLIGNDPDRYYRPAYFGDGWVGIRLDLGDNDWDHIGDWLAKSWAAVAPAKLRKSVSIADEF